MQCFLVNQSKLSTLLWLLRGGVPKIKLPCRESTITGFKINCRVLELSYLLAIHFSYTYVPFSIEMEKPGVDLFIQPLYIAKVYFRPYSLSRRNKNSTGTVSNPRRTSQKLRPRRLNFLINTDWCVYGNLSWAHLIALFFLIITNVHFQS